MVLTVYQIIISLNVLGYTTHQFLPSTFLLSDFQQFISYVNTRQNAQVFFLSGLLVS